MNFDDKPILSYVDTADKKKKKKKKSKGSNADPNFAGLLHNSVWSEYIPLAFKGKPHWFATESVGTNDTVQTETSSKSLPHNITRTFFSGFFSRATLSWIGVHRRKRSLPPKTGWQIYKKKKKKCQHLKLNEGLLVHKSFEQICHAEVSNGGFSAELMMHGRTVSPFVILLMN